MEEGIIGGVDGGNVMCGEGVVNRGVWEGGNEVLGRESVGGNVRNMDWWWELGVEVVERGRVFWRIEIEFVW